MKQNDISDDEIQILGMDLNRRKKSISRKRKLLVFVIIAFVLAICIALFFSFGKKTEPVGVSILENSALPVPDAENQPVAAKAFIEVQEETVNDVPLKIFIPHNAFPELALELPDTEDTTIVFVTQAADIGTNNYGIVGDFVLKGKQLAKGVRKEGFCAIVDSMIYIGVAAQTHLLQQAIEKNGYFFRQYPLVNNSEPTDNKPKNKSIRRALAVRNGKVMMVESQSRESFHDFAQALADSDIFDAIYLVGGEEVFGWYRDEERKATFFGKENEQYPDGVNYLVWKQMKKQLK